MSRDLKLNKTCDHRIIKEEVQIESDFRTIPIPRTITSKDVELWKNGYRIYENNAKFGWHVESDPRYVLSKRSKIVLDHRAKSTNNFYHISYSTMPEICPKCRGLRILSDTSYTQLGKTRLVENEEKLLQEVKKGLVTELGSNAFHTWIGTEIHTLIGSKVFNIDALRARIVQEVTKYLDKYLDIQVQQSRYQEVTNRESYYKTLSIEVTPEYDSDISYWTISIIFKNRYGENLLYEKTIEIPGPTNLLYGNK